MLSHRVWLLLGGLSSITTHSLQPAVGIARRLITICCYTSAQRACRATQPYSACGLQHCRAVVLQLQLTCAG